MQSTAVYSSHGCRLSLQYASWVAYRFVYVCLFCGLVGTPSLKSYRTATTLCVPDLVFNDISRHKILLPEGTPVQREILTGMLAVVIHDNDDKNDNCIENWTKNAEDMLTRHNLSL